MDKLLHEISAAALTFLASLMPAAIGATVSFAVEKGLTWSERFVQLCVGTAFSYFATNFATAIYPVSDPVKQGIGFLAGMVAYKAVPRVRESVIDALAGLPAQLRDLLPGKKKDAP